MMGSAQKSDGGRIYLYKDGYTGYGSFQLGGYTLNTGGSDVTFEETANGILFQTINHTTNRTNAKSIGFDLRGFNGIKRVGLSVVDTGLVGRWSYITVQVSEKFVASYNTTTASGERVGKSISTVDEIIIDTIDFSTPNYFVLICSAGSAVNDTAEVVFNNVWIEV